MVGSLDELLAAADIVTLHSPLTDETRGMLGAEQFGRMQAGAYLVNVSRGGLVNEPDLADALVSGHLGGAAIDVLSTEPPPRDSPIFSAPNTMHHAAHRVVLRRVGATRLRRDHRGPDGLPSWRGTGLRQARGPTVTAGGGRRPVSRQGSVHHQATCDVDVLAGHEGSAGTEQEDDHRGHLVGCGGAADGRLCRTLLNRSISGAPTATIRRSISSYIGVATTPGQTAFTRIPGAKVRAADRVRLMTAALLALYAAVYIVAILPAIDAEVDDAGRVGRPQQRQRGLKDEERPDDVDPEGRLPVVGGQLLEWHDRNDARRVDETIEDGRSLRHFGERRRH